MSKSTTKRPHYMNMCATTLLAIMLTACGGSGGETKEPSNSNSDSGQNATPAPTAVPTAVPTSVPNPTTPPTPTTPTPTPTTPTVDVESPSIPDNVSAGALSPNQVRLTWDASSDNVGVNAYTIYRDGIEIGSPSLTSFLDENLVADQSYQYTIIAHDVAGNSSDSSSVITAKTLIVQNDSTGFFPEIQAVGTTNFTVHPIESVEAGEVIRVSFGVPFPRGFLTNNDFFRILNSQNNEVAIFAKELLPWRDLGALEDLSSIRSALVQMDIEFVDNEYGQAIAQDYTVEWGVNRTVEPLQESDVKDDWVLVDDRNYPAEDDIYEPTAFAVFDANWYGKNVIKTRTLPFGSHDEFSAYDELFPLFGDTVINHVDPRTTDKQLQPYHEVYSNWLYDRAMTLYQLAFRSGEFKYLREAHRASQFYASKINDQGYFSLKPQNDMKYSYGESLLTNYMLQGDTEHLATVESMITAWDTFNPNYTLRVNFWTERQAAYKLLGYVTAFELLGDVATGQKAQDTFDVYRQMQINPAEGVPTTGGLMHLGTAHGDGGNQFLSSPWMSMLLLDAVERFYIHSANDQVPDFVMSMADFFKQEDNVSLYEWNGYGGDIAVFVPRYLAGPNVVHEEGGDNDQEHAIDAAKIMALAYYFSRKTGTPDESYLHPMRKLYMTQVNFVFPKWIRPTAPGVGFTPYRMAPPRKFSWWFRTTSNMDFLIGDNTSLYPHDGQTEPKLEISHVMNGPERYRPGSEYSITLTLENTGDIDAINVALILKTTGESGPAVSMANASSEGNIRGDSVVWKLGDIAANSGPQQFTVTATANDFEVIPRINQPVVSIIAYAEVRFCGDIDGPRCELPTSNYSIGMQTYRVSSNLDVRNPENPDTPPVVSNHSHSNDAQVNGIETFSADITDPDGIDKVDFYMDGKLFAEDSEAPYSQTYQTNALSDTSHTLTIVAYDNLGSEQTKAITIHPLTPDTEAPIVSIVSPAPGQYDCNVINVEYTATDDFPIESCSVILPSVSVNLTECQNHQIPTVPIKLRARLGLTFEGTEDTVIDSSTLAHSGQIQGATRTTGTPYGSAMAFDGLDDFLQFDDTQLDISDEVTVSFWLNPSQDEGVIIQQQWDYIGAESGWVIALGSNNHQANNSRSISWGSADTVGNYNNGVVVQTEIDTIDLDTWQHVAVTKSGTDVIIYINGVESARKTITTPDISWPPLSAKTFYVGRKMNNHLTLYQNYFSGQLDELFVWNETLSESQIQQLYANTPDTGDYTLTIEAVDFAGNVGSSSVQYTVNECE